ncbi:helicase associated domain-containing protein, partial [Pelagophyceae sp. CCMP2097]
WDARYLQLMAYREATGNCAVPQSFTTADGAKLRVWVDMQRRAYKADKLSPERVERLKAAVGFVWHAHADGWGAHFELLTAYHVAHGHCAVPFKFAAADGTKLGKWVSAQRRAYKAGELSPERAQRLEAVGFAWRV